LIRRDRSYSPASRSDGETALAPSGVRPPAAMSRAHRPGDEFAAAGRAWRGVLEVTSSWRWRRAGRSLPKCTKRCVQVHAQCRPTRPAPPLVRSLDAPSRDHAPSSEMNSPGQGPAAVANHGGRWGGGLGRPAPGWRPGGR
jgi:hypothetical protein